MGQALACHSASASGRAAANVTSSFGNHFLNSLGFRIIKTERQLGELVLLIVDDNPGLQP